MTSYVGLAALKARLDKVALTQDLMLRALLEAAARQFDEFLGANRTFRTYLATRYHTPARADRLLLDADLLAVTSLKTDEDGDRVYETTWAATDYDLKPFNAAVDKRPYWEVAVTPKGAESFPVGVARSVELVGKWGYFEDLVLSVATVAEALDATETGIDVSNGALFEALQTILVDSEQMYITGITSNTLTVERGVNGTTPATHSSAAAIRVYRYPWQVVEASIMHATKLWTRRAAGFADRLGLMDTGQVPMREGLDWAVMDMLSPFRQPVAV